MSTQERSKASFLQERYDFAAWRYPGQPSETLFVLNYLIAPSDLAGYRAEHIEELDASEGWPRSVRSLWRSKDADEGPIAVEVFEADWTRAAARETLAQSLGQFQAVLEPDEEVGEVAFATPVRGAVAFALTNLVGLVRTAGGPTNPWLRSPGNWMSTCARGPRRAGGSYPTSTGWRRGRGCRTERFRSRPRHATRSIDRSG